MKFYDMKKKEFTAFNDCFIEQYEPAYFYPKGSSVCQPLVKKLHRSSCYPESEIDRILRKGIHKPEDVVYILAWKIGRIAHRKCCLEKAFVYRSDWKELEDYENWAQNHQSVKGFPMKEIAEYIADPTNLEKWTDLIHKEDWFRVLEDFESKKKEKSWKGLGSVYYLTLLYFISKGKYPIFDQFAEKAIDAIVDKNEQAFPGAKENYMSLPSEYPVKEIRKESFKERYQLYCNRINSLKAKLSDDYREPTNRKLDRALWVYGHIRCADDVRDGDCQNA